MDEGFEEEKEKGRESQPWPEREALGEGGLADERIVRCIEFAEGWGGLEWAEVALGVGEIHGGEGDRLAGELPAIDAGNGGGF